MDYRVVLTEEGNKLRKEIQKDFLSTSPTPVSRRRN
jgi:hypothetical protein